MCDTVVFKLDSLCASFLNENKYMYGTRRKYCNNQGTHAFRLPMGTSTGARLGTDHGIRVLFGSGVSMSYTSTRDPDCQVNC